jgi:Domain of unknown function (DUF4337)
VSDPVKEAPEHHGTQAVAGAEHAGLRQSHAGLIMELLEGTLEVHEAHEHIEKAHHQNNKRAAILIVVLAALLAITEMAGKEAQFASIAHNIDTSDTYAYYQAKTIRSTTLQAALQSAELLPADGLPETLAAARDKQREAWKKEIDRLDTDPAHKEGRKELLEKAKALEELRDHEIHAYHDYEYAAAALQLAIVMASAAVITELFFLEMISMGLGLVGLGFAAIGWLAPTILNI